MNNSQNTLNALPSVARKLSVALDRPWITSIMSRSAVEGTLNTLHPMLSLTKVKARVVKVIDETATTKTFVLQPNALWNGAQSGQFIRVQVEIDGRLTERNYSLSSPGDAKFLAITVKRLPGGLVSNHLHTKVTVGTVLTISQASGEFVLPSPLPQKMLLLSAGSGITPVMSQLRELQQKNYQGDVIFLHACRSTDEAIFAAELHRIADDFPALTLMTHITANKGRLDARALLASVPDLAERATWICGPAEWMDTVAALWQTEAISAPLHSERFAAAPLKPSQPGTPVSVAFTASGKTFTTQGSDPLLMQAERAGLTPKQGCRIGICRSCQCFKTSGTVENRQTGEISSAPNELIRLCISSARSDVALDL